MRRLRLGGTSVVAGIAAMAVLGTAGPALAAQHAARPQLLPAAAGTGATAAHFTSEWTLPAYGQAAPGGSTAASQPGHRRADPVGQVVLPDLLAVAPKSVTAAQLASLARLHLVRHVIAVGAGQVRIGTHLVNIIGVSPAAFRTWTPPQTAALQSAWTALARGGFVTTSTVARRLHLRTGKTYRVSGARQPDLAFGGTAATGIPGVDALVGTAAAKRLGLVPRLGVLISAPGAGLASLEKQIRAVLGNKKTRFVSLLPARPAAGSAAASSGPLPVDSHVPSGRPTTYLQLFEESAHDFCPGLSWTVLAAIGQIESNDGRNEGPSSAGALGPMQFLPSTWSVWGITAFGEKGPPNIMDPYDAVPAAANYLCAAGASMGGGQALADAIFAYNHADWYVQEVLALAHEYGQEYR